MKEQLSARRRILWVAGGTLPDIGGAEWSLQANTCILKNTFGQIVLTGTEYGDRVIDGIPIIEVKQNFDCSYHGLMRWFRPEFVATQGIYSLRVLELSANYYVTSIYFLRAPTDINFRKLLINEKLRIVANSEWMSDWFFNKWEFKPIILHPIIIPRMAVCTSKRYPQYISHVGDAIVKGGDRIFRIANKLGKESFLVTKSWPALRNETGWDTDKIQQLRETDGSATNFETTIVDFGLLKNIKYIFPYLDPKVLYSKTKILLVASKWREPFGRVIQEALLNKIPVIVSPEAYNERWAGLVHKINDGDDEDEWINVINQILNNSKNPEIEKNIDLFCRNYSTSESERILNNYVFH